MAGDTVITVIGNLTAASTPRMFDRQTNEWKDGEALFLRCAIWREAAENVAESLTKGARVIVSGRLKQRSYETKEGEKRTVIELDVDEIGPSLRYATARVTKMSRGGGGGGNWSGGGGGQSGWSGGGGGGGGGQAQQHDDPWATGAGAGGQGAQAGGGFGSGYNDEPPF
jgi:single-strand DNA-binding protein